MKPHQGKKALFLSSLMLLGINLFFPPSPAEAASLGLNASFNGTVGVNQYLTIPAVTIPAQANVAISFTTTNTNVSFNPPQCTTDSSGSCSVIFKSAQVGNVDIVLQAPNYPPFLRSITVQQSTQLGTCVVSTTGIGGSSTSYPNKTKAECDVLLKGGVLGGNWSMYSPPVGLCGVSTGGIGGSSTSYPFKTEAECTTLRQAPGVVSGSWVAASPAVGSCLVDTQTASTPHPNKTKTECDLLLSGGVVGGGWTPNPSCTIQSAKFAPSGAQSDSWFKDGAAIPVKIDIKGTNCANQAVEVSITEKDNFSGDDDIAQLDNRPFTFDSNGAISFTIAAGETDCEQTSDPDCEYYITVYKAAGGDFDSHGKPEGNLTYQCDGLCDENWGGVVTGPGFTPKDVPVKDTSKYYPLVPLPDPFGKGKLTEVIVGCKDPAGNAVPGCDDGLGTYLNYIIRLIIGLAAVLAVVMIVWGGIEYMMTELIGEKAAAKKRITEAVLGLLLALGAWLILKEINPTILNTSFNPAQMTIVAYPDAGDNTVDPDFGKAGVTGTYTVGSPSSAVVSAVALLKQGWSIQKFNISTGSKTATATLVKGAQTQTTPPWNIEIGSAGAANFSAGQTYDNKTPMGFWQILSDIRYTPGVPQYNKKGSNMGAAYWLMDPMTSGERGIGIHGSKNGGLSPTNGCIRMTNADLIQLQPFIKSGISVIVQ